LWPCLAELGITGMRLGSWGLREPGGSTRRREDGWRRDCLGRMLRPRGARLPKPSRTGREDASASRRIGKAHESRCQITLGRRSLGLAAKPQSPKSHHMTATLWQTAGVSGSFASGTKAARMRMGTQARSGDANFSAGVSFSSRVPLPGVNPRRRRPRAPRGRPQSPHSQVGERRAVSRRRYLATWKEFEPRSARVPIEIGRRAR